ncbi:SHOCT domain-containing protein [Halohasta litorea]|uniref:SHOCT domain-containing protein n=1 Tax=Halohasta litorea TaxID=869891 RepID=A0ABD6D960_9EURY|nr:SHOCT domain-containing protein [Halohasta litorea]
MATTDTLLKTVLIAIIAVVLLPLVMMLVMAPTMGMWGGSPMWNGGMVGGTGSAWMWLLPWLVMLAVFGGLGYLLYRVLGGSESDPSDPAIEELRAAYARGDLSEEEFETRLERLRQDR